jgi:5-methylcytosine-specific restriction enzyme B
MSEQVIYFGAPGTGKSHYVKQHLSDIGVKEHKIFRVTIHPEFMYSDFVGQLLPVKTETGDVKFEFVSGPLTRALKEAFSDFNEPVYLVLEELSRGNVSAILGDTFQLLDRDHQFKSAYPIRNKNIADQIVELIDDTIYFPSNFNIICTVNLNDQSVFPMDTAFKRRFDWRYVSTLPATDEAGDVLTKLNNPKIFVPTNNDRASDIETNWHALYVSLNEFISDRTNGLGRKEDKQLGQFFIDFPKALVEASHTDAAATRERVMSILRNKLLLYLWNDVQGSSTFNNSKSLFHRDIVSYEKLYATFGEKQIFDDVFINEFLVPNVSKYSY